MFETLLSAALAFAGTNTDDIFILMILYAQAEDRRGTMSVTAGQFLGLGILTAVSMLAALGTQLFLAEYVHLLGLVPLALGIRALPLWHREEEKGEAKHYAGRQISAVSTALITAANGADNLSVYIPLFSQYSLSDFLLTLFVFALMTALWCRLGSSAADHPYVRKVLVRYKHIIVPAVLIVLGLLILVSGCTVVHSSNTLDSG